MSEIIVFNDLHLADKPPLGRKPGYVDEGLAMLEEVVNVAVERKALLVSSGDLFHVKRPSYTSHRLVQQVIGILSKLHPRLLIVPGNHDMGMEGMASLNEQPLGDLFAAGVAWPLTKAESSHGWNFTGRPYDVHRDADPDYYALTEEELDDCSHNDYPTLMVAHGSIIPPKERRPYPTVACTDIDMTGINVLCSGHIHEDLGVYPMQDERKGPIRLFANLGALGRVSRTQSDRERQVKALSVSVVGREYKLEEIPIKSALLGEDIFIEDHEALVDIASSEIAEFVASLAPGGFDVITPEAVESMLRGLELSDTIRARVLQYLEEADAH